jgi:flagellar protein FliO/FliZ
MLAAFLPIFAQDADETQLTIEEAADTASTASDALGVFTAWDFIRMILILGAVIAVIYLVFYLLKRSGNPRLQENRLIRILSSRGLSNGKSVHLVGVGNQVFLVGASENGVSLVSEISDKETLDGIRLESTDTHEGERQSFSEVLSSMFGREHRPVDAVGFLRQQRERLKQIQ